MKDGQPIVEPCGGPVGLDEGFLGAQRRLRRGVRPSAGARWSGGARPGPPCLDELL